MTLSIIEKVRRQKEKERAKKKERTRRRRLKRLRDKRRKAKKAKNGFGSRKCPWHIIVTNHGKRLHDVYWAPTEEEVYKKFNEIVKENKETVMFPKRWNNLKHVMVPSDYELIIIKKKDNELESSITELKDDSGKFVNYESSDDRWAIIDRAPYYYEETFWVYGYHPKLQRKDFNWIMNNFILPDIKNKYMIKMLTVYNNKLLIDCNGEFNVVICKTISDAIKMYNMIEEIAHKKKYRYIIFMGDLRHSAYKSEWIEKLKRHTGWNDTKMLRQSTRP